MNFQPGDFEKIKQSPFWEHVEENAPDDKAIHTLEQELKAVVDGGSRYFVKLEGWRTLDSFTWADALHLPGGREIEGLSMMQKRELWSERNWVVMAWCG